MRARARMCVCMYNREEKGQKLSSILRIKLVFTRLNFSLRLNSSPQFKRTMAKGNEREREGCLGVIEREKFRANEYTRERYIERMGNKNLMRKRDSQAVRETL